MIITRAMPAQHFSGVSHHHRRRSRHVDHDFAGAVLGYDPDTNRVLPHIHTSLGLKERSALGHTSHLLSARVQFLVEMLLVEIATPTMLRVRDPELYDVPLLRFGS